MSFHQKAFLLSTKQVAIPSFIWSHVPFTFYVKFPSVVHFGMAFLEGAGWKAVCYILAPHKTWGWLWAHRLCSHLFVCCFRVGTGSLPLPKPFSKINTAGRKAEAWNPPTRILVITQNKLTEASQGNDMAITQPNAFQSCRKKNHPIEHTHAWPFLC